MVPSSTAQLRIRNLIKAVRGSASADKISEYGIPTTERHFKHSKGTLNGCIVAFSKNSMLASGSFDETIRLSDSSSGALPQILTGHILGFVLLYLHQMAKY